MPLAKRTEQGLVDGFIIDWPNNFKRLTLCVSILSVHTCEAKTEKQTQVPPQKVEFGASACFCVEVVHLKLVVVSLSVLKATVNVQGVFLLIQ